MQATSYPPSLLAGYHSGIRPGQQCLGGGLLVQRIDKGMGFSCHQHDEVFIGDHTLRQVEQTILRIEKYQHCRDPLMAGLRFTGNSDYEGFPEDSLTLDKARDERGGSWRIGLKYHATGGGVTGDVYDYVKIVRRDRGTAYKMRPPGPPRETKFILDSGFVHSDDKVPLAQISTELSTLDELATAMDESTATLEAWAKSGLAMRVRCVDLPLGGKVPLGCFRETEIPAETLSDFAQRGLSLIDLQDRMICSKCGRRNPRLYPVR
jgi:hypothetical protein